MRLDWKAGLGIALSAVLLWWTLHDIDFASVWGVLRASDGWLWLASTATATLIFPIRARRWRTILDPVVPRLPFGPLWRATAVGMMLNNVAPGRAGELARAVVLRRERPDVPVVAVSDVKLNDADRVAWTAALFDLGARYVLFPPLTKPVLEDVVSGLMAAAVGRQIGGPPAAKPAAPKPRPRPKSEDDVIDLADEDRLTQFFHGTIESRGEHFATAARDLSEGGLSQAVVEAAVQSGVGIEISLDDVSADPFVALFSESASRALVAVREADAAELEARASEVGVPFAKVGRVLSGDAEKVIRVSGGDVSFEIPVAEAESAWRDTLPNLFAHAVGANSVVEAE